MSEQALPLFEDGFKVYKGVSGQQVLDALKSILQSSETGDEHYDCSVQEICGYNRGVRYYVMGRRSPHSERNSQIFLDGEPDIDLGRTYTDVAVRLCTPWPGDTYSYGKKPFDESYIEAVVELSNQLQAILLSSKA